ncbi:MAG: ABC transporter permease [Acidobacteriota bacterium]
MAQLSGVMTGGDRPRPVWRTLVSSKLLPLLRARPSLGRLLLPADFEAGAPPAAVLTDSMWRRHFGADPGIVGKSIHLDDQAFAVVGVVPDAVLRFLSQPSGLLDRVQDRQVISPNLEALAGGEARLLRYLRQQRDAPWFQVVGRVAPGRSVAEAWSEIAVVAQRLAAEHPATNARRGLRVTPLDAWRTANVRGTTTMLLAAALLVFLVSSASAVFPG